SAVRSVSGRGELGIALRRLVRRRRSCRIVANLIPPARGLPVEVSDVALQVRRIALVRLENPAPPRTYRAEWSLPQRAVHWICKRSRFWNSIVSEVEMRTGREELLSLPQYMALCPTGQCNASCGFCSVTINRTGIIKKQLPYERMDTFLAPVSGTIRLFGIEGNGEPTLYEQFD